MLNPPYFSVSPTAIREDQSVPFNMYVRVNGRYVLYQNQDEPMDPRRLQRLRASGVNRLFVRQEQKAALDSYLQKNLNVAYGGLDDRPIGERAALVVGLQISMISDLIEDPVNKQFHDVLMASGQRFADFCLKTPVALKAVLAIANQDADICHHGVRVAALSLGMLQKQNLLDMQPLKLVVMAAFLHDIEHARSGLNITRPVTAMDASEKAVYHDHPSRGVEQLRRASFYDPLVIQIILQHEEAMDGSGFPGKIRGSAMLSLASLVAAANHFDRYLTFEKMAAKDALKRLFIDQIGRMDLAQMTALQEVLKDSELV